VLNSKIRHLFIFAMGKGNFAYFNYLCIYISDNVVVLNLEGRDALLFADNGFVLVKVIQYTGSKWECSFGKYYDNINQIKKDKLK